MMDGSTPQSGLARSSPDAFRGVDGSGETRQTIFAHSSGRPPAAIAVIRISGPRAFDAGRQLAQDLPAPRNAALRSLRDSEGQALDEALILTFAAPASSTGENVVELHCHGGRAVVAAVLAELGTITGLREAEPGEFTRRAFENGRIDLTEAEGLADLLEAETESQRRAALSAARGGIRHQVEAWRARVIDLSARAEAAIDYVGDEDETMVDEASLQRDMEALGAELEEWLSRPRVERLKNGIKVVLAGPPNAGKSSLLNALAEEERAIVTNIPGTTRDVIEVPVGVGGIPFLFVDTAGIRASDNAVERIGIGRAEEEAAAADVLLWLGDAHAAPQHKRMIRISAKADLGGGQIGGLAVSALTGSGLDELRLRLLGIAKALLPSDPLSLNARQADLLQKARDSMLRQSADVLMMAEDLRQARSALDAITGRESVHEMLDSLFGRFCLGK